MTILTERTNVKYVMIRPPGDDSLLHERAPRKDDMTPEQSLQREAEAVDRMILLGAEVPVSLRVGILTEVIAARAAVNAVEAPRGRLKAASREVLRLWAARVTERDFVGLAEKSFEYELAGSYRRQTDVRELRAKLADFWFSLDREVPEGGEGGEGGEIRAAAKDALRRDILTAARLLEGDELIDLAARVASVHAPLEGKEPRLRVLLKMEASQPDLVRELAGGPHLGSFIADETLVASEAVATIWQEPMLDSTELSVALGGRQGNREKARVLRERSELLGLPHGRGFVYPAFQVDSSKKNVRPEVREVNQILEAAADPWGVASWWVSGNDRLMGARPIDVVSGASAPSVVAAARATVEPID